ncbi:hypothetical protein CF392_13050 [Tamilnaduibacter salinus]|uniref:EamA domain-containing protein n=1 Tax=Tamilnaduibacter salinus TaxID=1484056 RepID=A0A2A2I0X3_9GAMM|nr:DMT family transporter [Tamilnaduibacter salinus]PAV25058.1 hypothetical protein CF392_13050 [Tamilnaduibacter salinus]
MSGKTVNSAILLLVLGNAMALASDVFIKLLEPDTPIFQFVFLRSLLTLACLMPFLGALDTRQPFQGLGLYLLRGHIHLMGVACMVVSLTTLPLATANAIFYAAPVLVMVLSVVFFRGRLAGLDAFAVISGFTGIIVILQPVTINWMALSALGTALSLALNALLVKKLPSRHGTVHKLLFNYLAALPAAGALAWWEGAAWQSGMLVSAMGSAVLILGYNLTVLLAYHRVEASRVTSAEYTGLIWAILFGWVLFGEQPDGWFLMGSALIVGPLTLIGLRQRRSYRAAITNADS